MKLRIVTWLLRLIDPLHTRLFVARGRAEEAAALKRFPIGATVRMVKRCGCNRKYSIGTTGVILSRSGMGDFEVSFEVGGTEYICEAAMEVVK